MEVLAVRDLVPDGVEMSLPVVAVHQQFTYSLFYPLADGRTERFDAMWIDAEAIGLEIPDTFALDFAVSAVGATALDVDAFVERSL